MNSQIKCAVSGKCGGCSYTGIPYEKQLEKKQNNIEGLLGRFCEVSPIIGMDIPKHYRNKVHHVIGRGRSGDIISGCYSAGTHRIVRIDNCLIEDEICQEIIFTIRKLALSFKMAPYDEDLGRGLLRHVLVRRGFATGEIMVVLVLSKSELPGKTNFLKALLALHPKITTVIINVNNKKTSMVLGEYSKSIYGPGFIRDKLCGCTFRISPSSFYQVNPIQTEVLYGKVKEFASLTGTETVLDAYCGVGTIGLSLADSAEKVIGVELNKDAVKDAILNAKENKITNAAFYRGDAGAFINRMASEGKKADIIIMDPPRSGSTARFINSAVSISPEKIIYVSCGPESLKRDLGQFKAKGYNAVKIQPVDMFPYTEHVETVVLLSKGNMSSEKIRVEFDLEDMDMSDFKDRATYDEIRKWVQEKYGFHVTNLNIAQLKQKYGIIERENYNKPKSPDSRQPGCPFEKEEAIESALRFFNMI